MLTIEDVKKALTDVFEQLNKKEVVKIEKAANEMERKALFVVLAPDEVDAHGDTYSAKEIEKGYHELYKVSDQYVQDRLKQASKDGYVEVAFGDSPC